MWHEPECLDLILEPLRYKRLRGRDHHDESGSSSRGFLDRNLPAVSGYEIAYDRQSNSSTGGAAAFGADERLEDALFTGLRLSAGVDLKLLESRYGVDVWFRYGADLQPFVDEGLLIYDGAALRLTRAGMLLAHEVMAVFITATVRR